MLKVGIQTFPNQKIDIEPGADALASTLDLVKIGLIYGDEVEVACSNSSVVLQQIDYRDSSELRCFQDLVDAAKFCGLDSTDRERTRDIFLSRQVRRATRRQLRGPDLAKFDSLMETLRLKMEEKHEKANGWLEKIRDHDTLATLRGKEFVHFDLLQIPFRLLGDITDFFEKDHIDREKLDDVFQSILNQHLRAYGRLLAKYTQTPGWIPLFDDRMQRIAESFHEIASLEDGRFFNSSHREATAVRYLFNRLPRFRSMEIPEALEVRKELAPHTNRFRNTVLEMIDTLGDENFDDKNFAHEVELLARKKLDPAVEELEEVSKLNSLTKTFLETSSSQIVTGLSTLGIIFSSQIPALSNEIMLSGFLGLGKISYDAYRTYEKEQHQLKKNGCYFYQKLGGS